MSEKIPGLGKRVEAKQKTLKQKKKMKLNCILDGKKREQVQDQH